MNYREKTWMKIPDPVPPEQIRGEYHADIVILGGGHAGTAVALAALEAGATVILLEQQTEAGFRAFGAQFGALNSKFAQERGAPVYDPLDFMEDYLHRSLNRANPFLIRQYAHHSGETLDWMLAHLPESIRDRVRLFMGRMPKHYSGLSNGFRTFLGTAMFPNVEPNGTIPPGPPLSLTPSVKALHKQIIDLGGTIRYGLSCHDLIMENGAVVGAIGRNYKHEYWRFLAGKGVVLATGDFSGNKEMVMDQLQELAELTDYGARYPFVPGGRKGAGIQLGLLAGGQMEPGPKGGMWACVRGGGGPMDGSACLRLNCNGERFTNEGIYGYWGAGLQGARQPDGPIVTLWDANWREELEYQAMDHTNVDLGDPLTMELRTLQMEEAAQKGCCDTGGLPPGRAAAPNLLFAAQSLPELADKLGYSGQARTVFLEEVRRYNQLCALGRDEDFCKDPNLLHPIVSPPFFGYREETPAVGTLMVTVCGLVVDRWQQVLDSGGQPIQGLYATGNCSGGRFPMMYTTPISGISIGMAYTLGRVLGTHLAQQK